MLICVVRGDAHAQVSSEAFVKWARARAIPLRTVEPGDDATDLLPLLSLVGSARVVAFGEPTHGTHEPLAFRNRLIRFLIEHAGFTAIALEAGVTESHLMAQFVAGGPGDIHSVVGGGMTWGFGSLLENEELIRWVRSYNADQTHRRKVRLYGIDLTGGDAGEFVGSRHAVDFALTFLARADAVASRKLKDSLDPLLARFSSAKYGALSPSERGRLASGLAELTMALQRNRSALVQASSEDEYEWALRSAVVARQLNAFFEVSPPYEPPGGPNPPDADRQMNARDSAMAENVRWALEREGKGGRLVVFAHDMHVMNSTAEGGNWSKLRRPPSMMGTHLRAALGTDLVIIGTAARETTGDLPRINADSTSIEAVLASVALPRFVLDLRPARSEQPVAAWLSRRQTFHVNLNSHMLVAPGAAFDALLYLDTLTDGHWREEPPAQPALAPDPKALRKDPGGQGH